MTVISALISKKGIAVASDSMLTAYDEKKGFICLEWTKSKIVRCEKLKACLSYWGFAGQLKRIPKDNDSTEWIWQTHEWLKRESLNPKMDNIEEFSRNLCENLKKEFDKLGLKNNLPGIGIHIIGMENIGGYTIPELFLVSNFLNTSYLTTGELNVSRHTFHSMNNVSPSNDHREETCRFAVKDSLEKGELIFYNNGDPEMYSHISNSYSHSFTLAAKRGVVKAFNDIQSMVPTIRRPIEIICDIQRDFYEPQYRIVGGKIHDLAIDNAGTFYSTSGD